MPYYEKRLIKYVIKHAPPFKNKHKEKERRLRCYATPAHAQNHVVEWRVTICRGGQPARLAC